MQNTEKIRAISFREELKGKLIGFSKKKLIWIFRMCSCNHEVSLTYSIFSSKFTFKFNQKNKVKGERQLLSKLKFETIVDNLNFKIIEGMFTFDLYINDNLFQPGTILKPSTKLQNDPNQIYKQRISFRDPHVSSVENDHTLLKKQNEKTNIMGDGINLPKKAPSCFKKNKDVKMDPFFLNDSDGVNDNKTTEVENLSKNGNRTTESTRLITEPNSLRKYVIFNKDVSFGSSKNICSTKTIDSWKNIDLSQDRPIAQGIKTINRNQHNKVNKSKLKLNELASYELESEKFQPNDFRVYTPLEREVISLMF